MEDFDQYLKQDADEQERAAAKQVKQGLEGLRLERKLSEVAALRQALLRRRFWWRLAAWAALVILAGVAIWFYGAPAPKKPAPGPQQPTQETPVPQTLPETPENKTPDSRKNGPMADNRQSGKILQPRFPAPTLRGENQEDKAWKTLVDKIWYTEYPFTGLEVSGKFEKANQFLKARDFDNAFVQLQRLERTLPANDTLRFLKGYCLLEMGEGSDALSYFEKLELQQPTWAMHIAWYRGLSYLLTGDKEKALTVFQQIARSPQHEFREQSKHAIQILE